MAIDPICDMEVDPKTAKWKSEYNGQTYYFCAPGCKKMFDNSPDKYLGEVHEGHGGGPGHGGHGHGCGCCH